MEVSQFALGQISTEYTSPTLSSVDSLKDSAIPHGQKAIAHQPSVVLQPVLEPGKCWAFSGNRGHIGVTFLHSTEIHYIDLEHISPSLVGSGASAPKTGVLWALVGNQEARRLRPHLSSNELWSSVGHDRPIIPTFATSYKEDGLFFPLLAFSYNVSSSVRSQRFSVNRNILSLHLCHVRAVVLDIHENWGDKRKTCVYGLRVYGRMYE